MDKVSSVQRVFPPLVFIHSLQTKIRTDTRIIMDFLAGYASDSDSDGELTGLIRGRSDPKDQDEESILAALKDLQSFAAMVEPASTPPSTSGFTNASSGESYRTQDSGAPVTEDPDDQQFLSFLKEIEAIPMPETDDQPPPPPPLSPSAQTDRTLAPPPPPLPPTSDNTVSTFATLLDPEKAVHAIYNRLQNLSILPTSTIDSKDLERRMLEFEVRIEDWKNNGLETWYFLGTDRSQAIHLAEKQQSTTKDVNQPHMAVIPAFGGIVGAMEKRVQELELHAAPYGWRVIWDPEEEAYGFEHIQTGTYSPVYPSLEQLLYLDPPAPPPPSTSSNFKRAKGSHISSVWSTAASISSSPSNIDLLAATSPTATTAPLPIHNPWTSQSTSSHNLSNTAASDNSTNSKKKKRKPVEDSISLSNDFADPHIHPSRRAVLGPLQGVASSSISTSKTMPKKLANLLQKWNEKDKDPSDEEVDEDEEQDYLDSDGVAAAMSGANSQSLGGDWRERRLHHR